MKLHDAIIKILEGANRQMTTIEIADALNQNNWYRKKDSSLLTAYQVHGRTKNYPQFFDRTDGFVALKSTAQKGLETAKKKKKRISFSASKNTHFYLELVENPLIQEAGFKSAVLVDGIVPESPGLYCIRINNLLQLPKEYALHLTERGHNILYIGIATKSLKKRFLSQDLRAIGHGTFFRSLGALLGFKPPK